MAGPQIERDHQAVEARLDVLAGAFPEVAFMTIGGASRADYVAYLPALLGDTARNLDYEHPDDVRQLLVDAQLNRIHMMLENDEPSATLFQVGEDSQVGRPYLCVITLDPDRFLGDNLAATAFMSGAETHELSAWPDERVLDNEAFIRYTLDHEAFHCLAVYLRGPYYLMGSDDVTAEYQRFRAEFDADLFAALAFRDAQNDARGFMENMLRMRQLSLFNDDPVHYTGRALRTAMRTELPVRARDNLVEFAAFVIDLADGVAANRAGFKRHAASAQVVTLP
ncbi:MAG: hypothetical protein JSW10_00225 [Pseudomonadota bacterium]|nr:MAG: hypothetical protein JSW10_00225 [Pseudomonadota bacterium]